MSSFETRLRTLEAKFGLPTGEDSQLVVSDLWSSSLPGSASLVLDVGGLGGSLNKDTLSAARRLEMLEQHLQALFFASPGALPALKETWAEIDQYLEGLDAGSALTHQQQIVAPLLYRRQEILALKDNMRLDMQHIVQVSSLLLISHPNQGSDNNSTLSRFSEQDIIQAPILGVRGPDSADQRRMEALERSLRSSRERLELIMRRVDHCLDRYHTLIAAGSEKIVLFEEELRGGGPPADA